MPTYTNEKYSYLRDAARQLRAAARLLDKAADEHLDTKVEAHCRHAMTNVQAALVRFQAHAEAPKGAEPRCQDQLTNGPSTYTCQLRAHHDGAHRHNRIAWN